MKIEIFSAKHRPKICAVIFTLAMSLVAVSGGAIAKYIQGSERLKNDVSLAKYDSPKVTDTVTTNSENQWYKSNVVVEVSNDHNYPVYVRVSIIVTWQDESGNVYYKKPVKDIDYTLTRNTTDWTIQYTDAPNNYCYYYYNQAVASGGTTLPLIGEDQSLTQISKAPDGYTMHVEILTETIQAIGVTSGDSISAVMDAWKVQPDKNTSTTTLE